MNRIEAARRRASLPESASCAAAPFLKWAGGKTQLLAQLSRFIPGQFNVYVEPFVGSAALFFWLRRARGDFAALLSDSNAELTNCYEIVRDGLDELLPILDGLQRCHSKEHYYRVRDQNPGDLTRVRRAARLIYLNKTCFNGLYRVNSKGTFNVPIGSYRRPRIYDEAALRRASAALKGVELLAADFAEVEGRAGRGDFVYLDPPYQPLSKTSSFTGYSRNPDDAKASFGIDQQERLARTFAKLSRAGCLVMLSNSDSDLIRRLYRRFTIRTVAARRAINSDGTKRGVINEVVITSY